MKKPKVYNLETAIDYLLSVLEWKEFCDSHKNVERAILLVLSELL